MKTDKKLLTLMENGFRPSTLQKLTDGQINALYNRIVEATEEQKEAIEKTIKQVTYDPSLTSDAGELAKKGIKIDPTTKKVTLMQGKEKESKEKVIQDGEMKEEKDDTNKKIDMSELKFLRNLYKKAPTEKIKKMISNLEMEIAKSEMKEGDSLGALSMQDYTGQEGPHDEKDMAPDGMDDDSDDNRKMMGEAKKKKSKAKNPWAICTTAMGEKFGTTERSEWSKKEMNKYERCVLDVKKTIKEGKNPYEFILEKQILSLMERELHPRMTKADLLKTIHERKHMTDMFGDTKTAPAPVKPDVKPDTPSRPKRRPGNVPGPDPSPKARKERMESETAPAPVKPDVKPDTPSRPKRRPGHVPGPDPSPKAKSSDEKKDKYMKMISKILRNEK